MPKDESDPADPMEFHGVGVPGTPTSDRDMATAVVEEFLLLGFDRERILRLFRDPYYAGTHRIAAERGMEFVNGIVDEVLAQWAPVRAEQAPAAPKG